MQTGKKKAEPKPTSSPNKAPTFRLGHPITAAERADHAAYFGKLYPYASVGIRVNESKYYWKPSHFLRAAAEPLLQAEGGGGGRSGSRGRGRPADSSIEVEDAEVTDGMRAAAEKQAVISNQALLNDSFKMFNEVLGGCEGELTELLEAHERWPAITRSRCGVDIYLFVFDSLNVSTPDHPAKSKQDMDGALDRMEYNRSESIFSFKQRVVEVLRVMDATGCQVPDGPRVARTYIAKLAKVNKRFAEKQQDLFSSESAEKPYPATLEEAYAWAKKHDLEGPSSAASGKGIDIAASFAATTTGDRYKNNNRHNNYRPNHGGGGGSSGGGGSERYSIKQKQPHKGKGNGKANHPNANTSDSNSSSHNKDSRKTSDQGKGDTGGKQSQKSSINKNSKGSGKSKHKSSNVAAVSGANDDEEGMFLSFSGIVTAGGNGDTDSEMPVLCTFQVSPTEEPQYAGTAEEEDFRISSASGTKHAREHGNSSDEDSLPTPKFFKGPHDHESEMEIEDRPAFECVHDAVYGQASSISSSESEDYTAQAKGSSRQKQEPMKTTVNDYRSSSYMRACRKAAPIPSFYGSDSDSDHYDAKPTRAERKVTLPPTNRDSSSDDDDSSSRWPPRACDHEAKAQRKYVDHVAAEHKSAETLHRRMEGGMVAELKKYQYEFSIRNKFRLMGMPTRDVHYVSKRWYQGYRQTPPPS
jgi:hypothetical protein